MLFRKIGMVGVVECDACVINVQWTLQEAHQSSTRCAFIAVGVPCPLNQCDCYVEGMCLVAMQSNASL